MSIMDRLRQLVTRARAGAADVAQVANLKLDIRSLEGRRDHLLREMGRKAFQLHGEGKGLPELAPSCQEIAQVERQIREKEVELQAVRERSPSAVSEEEEKTTG